MASIKTLRQQQQDCVRKQEALEKKIQDRERDQRDTLREAWLRALLDSRLGPLALGVKVIDRHRRAVQDLLGRPYNTPGKFFANDFRQLFGLSECDLATIKYLHERMTNAQLVGEMQRVFMGGDWSVRLDNPYD